MSDPHGKEVRVSKLGVGFIGCGRIMDLNILGYLDRDDVEVAAFCDVSEEKLKRGPRSTAGTARQGPTSITRTC